MTDSVPEKLGKYKIIEEVGRGGFAAVYKAVDTTLDRTVALKVLASHLLWDPTFVQRFQREAKVAANLDHPHIVTIYEVGQIEGVYFIAMQFLEGRTLSQILKAEGRLPVSRVQAIIGQIASALDYAHARDFVHRDIKPSNIIVADDGQATLTDFGLVRAGEGTQLTATGVVFGTPQYMSPEQAEGKVLDARSDIYSLGVVLYEMLAGRAPFVADTTPAVMYKHVHEPPPLAELPSDLPQGMVAVVGKALAKKREDRFTSAGALAVALGQAVSGAIVEEVKAPPLVVAPPPEMPSPEAERALAPSLPLAAPVPTAVPEPLVTTAEERRPERLKLSLIVAVFGAGLLAVIVLAIIVVVAGIAPSTGKPKVARGIGGQVVPRASDTPSPTASATVSPTPTKATFTPTPVPPTDTPTPRPPTDTPTPRPPTDTPTPRPPTDTPTPQPPTDTPTPRPPTDTPTPAFPLGVFQDFESGGTWKRGDQPYGEFRRSTAQVCSGSYAGQLTYDFPTVDNEFVVFLQTRRLAGRPNAISAWVYGDNCGHYLNVWIRETTGEVWQAPFGRIEHIGWQRMTAWLDPGREWPHVHISGPSNNAIDYPISFYALVLDDIPDTFSGHGTIYVDDLASEEGTPPLPAPTPTQPGGYIVEISASPNRISVGGCTTLSWHIENVHAAYLNGEGITGPYGSKQVCPNSTTTYVLTVNLHGGGSDSRSVTVEVTGGSRLLLPPRNVQGVS